MRLLKSSHRKTISGYPKNNKRRTLNKLVRSFTALDHRVDDRRSDQFRWCSRLVHMRTKSPFNWTIPRWGTKKGHTTGVFLTNTTRGSLSTSRRYRHTHTHTRKKLPQDIKGYLISRPLYVKNRIKDWYPLPTHSTDNLDKPHLTHHSATRTHQHLARILHDVSNLENNNTYAQLD